MMIPMAIISAINITIGSRWRVALKRAKAAGRMLAHVLAAGRHGDRPVTLVGFSMGARVAFHCLLELERMGQRCGGGNRLGGRGRGRGASCWLR